MVKGYSWTPAQCGLGLLFFQEDITTQSGACAPSGAVPGRTEECPTGGRSYAVGIWGYGLIAQASRLTSRHGWQPTPRVHEDEAPHPYLTRQLISNTAHQEATQANVWLVAH